MSDGLIALSPMSERLAPGIVVLCIAAVIFLFGYKARYEPRSAFRFGRSESAIRHMGLGLGLCLGSLLALLLTTVENRILHSQNGLHPSLIALSELTAALLVAVLVSKQQEIPASSSIDRRHHFVMALIVGALAAILAIGGWPCQS